MKLNNNKIDENNEDTQSEEDEYQALTNREEYDLERLMEQCEFTIHNAPAFTEQLSREVSAMDTLNIETIMASEQKVEQLMTTLSNAIEETFRLEQKIDHYLNNLKNVRDVVLQVEQKESQVKTEQENKKKLEASIETLINQLDFPIESEKCLIENDLNSRQGIRECIKAAELLQSHLTANIHPSLNYLTAVQEQKNYLEKIQLKFSERLSKHVAKDFNYQVERYLSDMFNTINQRDMTLPSHESIHNGLHIYKPLVKWLNYNNNEYLIALTEKYEVIMKSVYDKEFISYFELVKEKSFGTKFSSSIYPENSSDKTKKLNSTISGHDTINSTNSSFTSTSTALQSRIRSSSIQENFDTISSKGSEVSMSEWEEFDSCVERILNSIDPICLAEQQFCVEFFNLDNIVSTTSVSGNGNNLSNLTSNVNLHRRVSNVSANNSISHSISTESQNSNDLQERKNKNVKEMMSKIFSILEQEFINYVMYYDKIDGLYSMYLLVRLTQHVLSAQDKGSFLAKTYGNILIYVKRNFDKFINAQQSAIEETKIPKKLKCGIFPFVKKFEHFSKQAENVFKNSGGRRADIDKGYKALTKKMFEIINILAKQHHKTPEEMVLLENYHYLHNVLCTLKISCLEAERKEAKNRYNAALKDYVSRYFGRPLEKLNVFFEGVQQKVLQGVKEEEVGYQLAYSKQELRKIIKDCSLKEVKKGLEEMYKKVEKHTSEPDSTLIQVIWRSMQEEFISQYKAIQSLMQRCYPDANINLSFTVENVLNVFSEIAQSH